MRFKSLDEFLSVPKKESNERSYTEPSPSAEIKRPEPIRNSQQIVPRESPPSFFISATYDGERRSACIKLYEPLSERIQCWYDTRGHKPYCFTNIPQNELEKMVRLVSHPGFDSLETVEKYDALLDRKITVTKILAKDPLAIGGRPKGCIRDIIPEDYPVMFGSEMGAKVWEAAIKYYQCYIYDQELEPGMLYRIKDSELIPIKDEEFEKKVEDLLKSYFKDESEDFVPYLKIWARLLEYPAPEMRRAALDIEVFSPVATRVPDPQEAGNEVICASFVGSDGKKRVLVLKREGIEMGDLGLSPDVNFEFYSSERDLLRAVFRALSDYPFIITFNGDDFDLSYLYHRALNLGFGRDEIPIEHGRESCLVRYGVHIDLYKFFFNRSIQIYAFAQRYRNVTLDEIGEALLGQAKIKIAKPLSELSYGKLAEYCLNDAEITLKLTAYDDDLVMKLLLVLTRVSRMPMEDVSRLGVSRWIRSFMQYEHRRRGMLIPNKEDIVAVKGETVTKAIIKGKKYKGAIVVEPVPGIHFNVAVMDFQSLYPSIIKVFNLGYQSILCPHKECRDNKVPDTPHWICKKQRALESALIGSLRDLRVIWYKPKAKDRNLPKEMRNWYDVIQSALKVILNASYGVFGAETFDLYCPPVAEATAAIGRNVITQTIDKASKLGIEVIYGDTDSLFLKNPARDKIEALVEWSKDTLGMELEMDKLYRYAVLSSRKKNYLGILDDGKVDVKGLTGKKRHIPLLIKRSFDRMEERLSQVKSPAEFEKAKKDVRGIIQECYSKLKRREWDDMNDLAFEVVLGKIPKDYDKTTPQHVKAASFLEERGREIKAGDTIRFVKVIKAPHVKPVELTTKNEVDIDKYVDYLRSTFDQVLDALGLEFDEIIGLTRLEQFMSFE